MIIYRKVLTIMEIVSVTNLKKAYGKLEAVNEFPLVYRKGSIWIFRSNGAGKDFNNQYDDWPVKATSEVILGLTVLTQ